MIQYETKTFSAGYLATLADKWTIKTNEKRTEIILELATHCRMKIEYDFHGTLIVNMPSLGFDNSVENFSRNAELLKSFHDFWETAQLIDKAERNFEKFN